MKASDLDFSTLNYFKAHEFPSDVLSYMDSRLIKKLDEYRKALGHSLTPSPLRAGWVREGGSTGSQHYIGPVQRNSDGTLESRRLSGAGDLFPARSCDLRHAFMTALRLGFGGIGVYLDTRGPMGTQQYMIHLDIREGTPQVWMRDDGKYIYPYRGDTEMDLFYKKLSGITAA